MYLADFLNTAAHLLLFFLAVRWYQMKFPDGGTTKALSYLFH